MTSKQLEQTLAFNEAKLKRTNIFAHDFNVENVCLNNSRRHET